MSTKNISRTMVEGGKCEFWKFRIKAENKRKRRAGKLFALDKAGDDVFTRAWLNRQSSYDDKGAAFVRFLNKNKRQGKTLKDARSCFLKRYGRYSTKVGICCCT